MNRYRFRILKISDGTPGHRYEKPMWDYFTLGTALHPFCHDTGTVGQFTGLQDKNGEDIYEGDIVKSVSEIIKPFERANKQKTGKIATKYLAIEYRGDSASFCIAGSALSSIHQKQASKYYEVVGNIHQAPELLTT